MAEAERALAIDIGNSRICCGLFIGGQLNETWNYSTADPATASSHLNSLHNKYGRGLIAVSSVVPGVLPSIIEQWPKAKDKIFEVSANSQTLISGLYDTMGSDRVANAAAAFKLHTIDAEAAVVIDFGTATTLTAVNNKGNFLGGMITLGLTKTFQALHYSTAQLPELSVQELENLSLSSPLAFDTQTAIERGCVIGHIGMVRYWLERALKSLPSKTTVVATGGLARLIAPAIKLFDHVDVNLTLKGIKIIGEAAEDQVGQV